MATHPGPPGPRPVPLGKRQVQVVIGALMITVLLAALDQNILATAMPTVVSDLGGLDRYPWVITAYLLTGTAAMPLYGRIGDLRGRRPVLMFAIGTFVAGSVLCGVSQTILELILARGVQGIGAGGLVVLAFTIVSQIVPPAERGRRQGSFGAIFGVASLAGPLLGGYLAEHGWRWIFFLNIPLGLAALAAVAWGLRALPRPAGTGRVDLRGCVFLVAGTAGLVLAASWGGGQYSWGDPHVTGALVFAAVMLALLVRAELGARTPLLPIRLLRIRSFWVGGSAAFLLGIVMFGSIVYLPVYLQLEQGRSPTVSGLMLLPLMGTLTLVSVAAGWAISRTGRYKWFIVAGAVLTAAGVLAGTGLSQHTPLSWIYAMMAVTGAGLGLCVQPLVLVVQAELPPPDLGAGTATGAFLRQLGASFGVAILGTILTAGLRSQAGHGAAASPVTSLPGQAGGAPHGSLTSFADALHTVFAVAGGCGLLLVAITLIIPDLPLRRPPRGGPEAAPSAGAAAGLQHGQLRSAPR
ncbi:MAG TPA: MDR family MFS transporter [Streptosporangiaceae bacterium]